jgi:hypothetical protein
VRVEGLGGRLKVNDPIDDRHALKVAAAIAKPERRHTRVKLLQVLQRLAASSAAKQAPYLEGYLEVAPSTLPKKARPSQPQISAHRPKSERRRKIEQDEPHGVYGNEPDRLPVYQEDQGDHLSSGLELAEE